MGTTSDRSDPRLTHGVDTEPAPMAEAYLVLSEEERAKGYRHPLRRSYRHVGSPGPAYPLRDLTDEEKERYPRAGYVKFEDYGGERAALGRFWTQPQLDAAGKGCRTVTTMGAALAETYARDPAFYGATYCCGCRMHLRVGEHGEFTWMTEDGQDTSELVGT